MSTELFVGAISGTSVDGLDLALLEVADDQLKIRAGHTEPLPAELRQRLIDLGQGQGDNLDALGEADTHLGQFIGHAVLSFLQAENISHRDIAAIGTHGQTVRHRPSGTHPFTMQIGDPSCIAEATRLTTVADFRRRDMAAGGEAAPLVPPFHAALFHHDACRVVANIGGISNITVLDANAPLLGFDTGPGNALLDAWYQQHHPGQAFDADAVWAKGGSVDASLLARLLTDPYLAQPPPKSTGKEHYHLSWLREHLAGDLNPRDVQRTLTEFTVVSLADAIAAVASPDDILICGGGRLNPLLMEGLAERTGRPVRAVEAAGVDGDALEAAAFAWLAYRRLREAPGNAPSVTGAVGERVLGAIYAP